MSSTWSSVLGLPLPVIAAMARSKGVSGSQRFGLGRPTGKATGESRAGGDVGSNVSRKFGGQHSGAPGRTHGRQSGGMPGGGGRRGRG